MYGSSLLDADATAGWDGCACLFEVDGPAIGASEMRCRAAKSSCIVTALLDQLSLKQGEETRRMGRFVVSGVVGNGGKSHGQRNASSNRIPNVITHGRAVQVSDFLADLSHTAIATMTTAKAANLNRKTLYNTRRIPTSSLRS